jgi:lipopolysaccharide assembly protein A
MQILIFLALIVSILTVIFAIQNITPVTVTFFTWSFNGSLALLLLLAVGVGLLISLLASTPGWIRGGLNTSSQKKKMTALEAERNNYQKQADEATKRADEAQKEVKVLEEQLASLSAELEKVPMEKEEGN